MKALALKVWPLVVALLLSMLCGSALISVAGQAPSEIYRLMAEGTIGSGYGVGQMFFKATPLIFCGLSVALCLRAGLFNVGADGQLTLGAFCAALLGAALPVHTPAVIAIPLCLVAAFAGGALLGAVAGVLKAYRGAHEVIVTIMLNFIVRAALLGAGRTLFDRETIHTSAIIGGARLRLLSTLWPALAGSHVSTALFLALACCVIVYIIFFRTRAGFEWSIVGQAAKAAETAGISVRRAMITTLTLAGGLAGVGASSFVLGYKYYYEDGLSGGVGFLGIAVAILAVGHPLALILSALLFGLLSQGALAINARVPKELVDILLAVVILSVAVVVPEAKRRLRQKHVG